MKRTLKSSVLARIEFNSDTSYHGFMKKGYRTIANLQINKDPKKWPTDYSYFTPLFKAIKNTKYTRKLDLTKLGLCSISRYLPKILCFAKRMSRANSIKILDLKRSQSNFRGISEYWAKYTKRVEKFMYRFVTTRIDRDRDRNQVSPNALTNCSKFLHLLRYQPCVKDLTIKFAFGDHILSEKYWIFKNYPATLERLTLKNPIFLNHPLFLNHLSNLKHLEIGFSKISRSNTPVPVLPFLSSISSHLQSLSLDLNGIEQSSDKPNFAVLKSLDHLKRLNLKLQFFKQRDLANVLKQFTESSINHLTLTIFLHSEKQLIHISNFIKSLTHLHFLKLDVSWRGITPKPHKIKDVLKQAKNLSLLTSLAISFTSRSSKQEPYQEFTPSLNKIINNAIPLTCFKVEFRPVNLSNKGLMKLLKSLQHHASTLIKIKIHIGEYKMNQSEVKKVLDFLKSFKNIRCLRLESLMITNKAFLVGFIDVIYGMPFIRTLSLGQITFNDELFLNHSLKRILEKRGLRKFNCQVSNRSQDGLDPFYEQINIPEIMKKKNPHLKIVPQIDCFNDLPSGVRYWKGNPFW